MKISRDNRSFIEIGEYTNDFKSAKVIAPVNGSTGNERFYVMSLDDIDSRTHYWYYYARGRLDNSIKYNGEDFGKGRENTQTMINKWNNNGYGEQNSNDMWGLIQNEEHKNWFVPSKTEWSAFGGEILEKLGIDNNNYQSYGLNSWYWSSSQGDTSSAYCATFQDGVISLDNVNHDNATRVRMATTF